MSISGITEEMLSKNNIIYFGDFSENQLLKRDANFNKKLSKYPHIGYVALMNSPSETSKYCLFLPRKLRLTRYFLILLIRMYPLTQ